VLLPPTGKAFTLVTVCFQCLFYYRCKILFKHIATWHFVYSLNWSKEV